MRKIKKIAFIIFLVVIPVIIVFSCWTPFIYYRYKMIHSQNVFEEIYYFHFIKESNILPSFTLNKEWRESKWNSQNDECFFIISHEGNRSSDNKIYVKIYKKPYKKIEFLLENGSQQNEIVYSLSDQCLSCSELTNTDFLYNIILSEWFSNEKISSKFSINNLGKYIDNTEKD